MLAWTTCLINLLFGTCAETHGRAHVGRRTSQWLTRTKTGEGKLISLTSQTQMAL